MSAHLTTTVTCYMTPADLRMIADKMEVFWDDDPWGKATTVYTWIGENVDVRFAIDQDRYKPSAAVENRDIFEVPFTTQSQEFIDQPEWRSPPP